LLCFCRTRSQFPTSGAPVLLVPYHQQTLIRVCTKQNRSPEAGRQNHRHAAGSAGRWAGSGAAGGRAAYVCRETKQQVVCGRVLCSPWGVHLQSWQVGWVCTCVFWVLLTAACGRGTVIGIVLDRRCDVWEAAAVQPCAACVAALSASRAARLSWRCRCAVVSCTCAVAACAARARCCFGRVSVLRRLERVVVWALTAHAQAGLCSRHDTVTHMWGCPCPVLT
jgi:hypothetical protein